MAKVSTIAEVYIYSFGRNFFPKYSVNAPPSVLSVHVFHVKQTHGFELQEHELSKMAKIIIQNECK